MEKEFDKKLFALRLKEIRKGKKLTQEELCNLTGIDVSNYCKMETGKITPSLYSLFRLIKIANFAPDEIFEYEHLINEKNLDENIFKIYKTLSLKQKQFLYKFLRNLEDYR